MDTPASPTTDPDDGTTKDERYNPCRTLKVGQRNGQRRVSGVSELLALYSSQLSPRPSSYNKEDDSSNGYTPGSPSPHRKTPQGRTPQGTGNGPQKCDFTGILDQVGNIDLGVGGGNNNSNNEQEKHSKHGRRLSGFQSIKPIEVPTDFKPPVFRKNPKDREFLNEIFKNLHIFEALPDNKLRTLVLASETLEFEENQVLVRQGDSADYLFILHTGFVRFEIDGEVLRDLKTDEVVQAGPGAFFGEMALLYNCTRAATVVAQTAGTLFQVDFQTILKVREEIHIQSTQDKVALLQGAPFLREVDNTTLQKCASVLQSRRFCKDEMIVSSDQPPDRVYFIEDGKVFMKDEGDSGEKYEDVILGPGECFGESTLLFDEPRSFSVTALSDVTVFIIENETFERAIGNLDHLNKVGRDVQILNMIKNIRGTDFLHAELVGMAERITDASYSAGTFVFKEGEEVESTLYLVRKGTVILKNASNSKTVKGGDYFGIEQLTIDCHRAQEDSSFTDAILDSPSTTKAMYTVEVTEDCVVGKLTLKDCRAVVDTTMISQSRVRSTKNFQSVQDDEITFTSLEKHRILGSGSFGQVWLVSRQSKTYNTKNWYALKIQPKYEVVKSQNVDRVLEEKDLLIRLRHPFVMTLRTTYQDPGLLYMLFDYIPGGLLLDRIVEYDFRGMPVDHAAFYAACLFEAVKYIHGRHVMHRDIKPENVMLNKEGYPVLVDFGFAKRVTTAGKCFTFLGTPMYMAPELILNEGHDFACDIWSLGILTYELLVGETPFIRMAPSHMSQLQLFNLIREGDIDYDDLGHIPDSAITAMKGVLQVDPIARWGAQEIQECQWFSDYTMDYGRLRRHEMRAPWIPEFNPEKSDDDESCFEKPSSTPEDMMKKEYPAIDPISAKKLKFF